MMIKNLCLLVLVSLCFFVNSHATTALKYEINDIGTLQTHSSQAIALNNQGQILGWFNIDGSRNGKHFFLREKDGEFYELPQKGLFEGLEVNWQFLTDEGKVYGTIPVSSNSTVLCQWEQSNGFVNLGVLPGKEIAAINDNGQVLLKSVSEQIGGKTIVRPVIWHNGTIVYLNGLKGDLGIESEISSGFDMNNKGEVVGESICYIPYKNNIYQETHAVKWVDGKVIDLHKSIPRSVSSSAIALNDSGDMLIEGFTGNGHSLNLYFIGDNKIYTSVCGNNKSITNSGFSYSCEYAIHKNLEDVIVLNWINNDIDSIWRKIVNFVKINDNGEIIAEGQTIYGEKHAMLLTPLTK